MYVGMEKIYSGDQGFQMSVIDFAWVSLFLLVCRCLDFTLTVVAGKKFCASFFFLAKAIFTCIRTLITITPVKCIMRYSCYLPIPSLTIVIVAGSIVPVVGHTWILFRLGSEVMGSYSYCASGRQLASWYGGSTQLEYDVNHAEAHSCRRHLYHW